LFVDLKNVFRQIDVIFSIVFVMGDVTPRLLEILKKMLLLKYVLSCCVRAREKTNSALKSAK